MTNSSRSKADYKISIWNTSDPFIGRAITPHGIVSITVYWRLGFMALEFVWDGTCYRHIVRDLIAKRLVPSVQPGVFERRILKYIRDWLPQVQR